MKVLLVNGSRRENGNTFAALSTIAAELQGKGIDSEIIHVGKAVSDAEMNNLAKGVAERIDEFDGIVLGSPVYYASPSGEIIAFLDRFWMMAENKLRYKPAAALAVARRAGTVATVDVLNKYLTYCEMPVITSRYWNVAFGQTPGQVELDAEGMQIMRQLAGNMAWIIKSIEAGKQAGVEQPTPCDKVFFNYVRE